MIGYVARRLGLMVPTLIGVAVLVFFLLRVMPGDVVELKLRGDGAPVTAETLAAERARLGLDKSLAGQFADWMTGLATLEFGRSMWTDKPVSEEIGSRIGVSLQVAFMASLIAVVIAIPLGTVSALAQNSWIDQAVRVFAVAGLAIPSFWLGMLIIMGLLFLLKWLPPVEPVSFFRDPLANLSQLIWPALSVGYRYAAVATRMMRSSMLEVLKEDYMRTARAKGLWQRLVIVRHAMPNALLPVVTVIGVEFAFLIGGLVVTEEVFNINGIGKLFVKSVTRGDYTMVQGLVMLVATIFILVNLAVDLLYGVLDPRIRAKR